MAGVAVHEGIEGHPFGDKDGEIEKFVDIDKFEVCCNVKRKNVDIDALLFFK